MWTLLVSILLPILLIAVTMPSLLRKKLEFKDKHVYITGGSQGLGLALAEYVARRGAHVTIVARDVGKLERAVEQIKAARASPSQRIHHISADLISPTPSFQAFTSSITHHSLHPTHIFLCAGSAFPGYFTQQSPAEIKKNHDTNFYPAFWTAHAVVRSVVEKKVRGVRVVFVTSFLGMSTFVGHAGYSAGKYAVRGLSDNLRSESLLYSSLSLKIHLYIPAGILSPGLENERLSMPPATRKVDEGDTPISCEEAVGCLIAGMEKGYYQITNDLITDLVRTQSRGAVPFNNILWDMILTFIAFFGLPIWRLYADSTIRSFGPSTMSNPQTNLEGLEELEGVEISSDGRVTSGGGGKSLGGGESP